MRHFYSRVMNLDGRAFGGAWAAEMALAIARYAAVAAAGLEVGVRIATTHSGESASTGAIVGNLLGLPHPTEVMRHPWGDQVEMRGFDRLSCRRSRPQLCSRCGSNIRVGNRLAYGGTSGRC